jgi:acetyltransferase-like isoleucine patch superfamily enzyme
MKNFLNKIKYKLRVFLDIEIQKPAFFTKDNFKGEKYSIGDYSYGCPTVLFENDETNLTIGKFCSIAEGVTIFLGGNHRVDWMTTYPFNVLTDYFPQAKGIKGHPTTKGNVIIGHDVWIGRNVTIMSGVEIGNGAVIGTESVISKNVGAYEIWAGNPAKFIKKRFDQKTIDNLEKLKWWDLKISTICENLDILCSDNLKNLNL